MCAQNKTDLKHLDSRPGFSLSQHSENVSSASSSPSAFLGLTMLETVMPNCSNKTKPSCDASKKNRNFQKSPEQGLAHEVFALNWGVWRKFRGNTQAFEHFITLSPWRLSHYCCLVIHCSSSEVQRGSPVFHPGLSSLWVLLPFSCLRRILTCRHNFLLEWYYSF